MLDQAIRKRALPVVDVGYNAEIAYVCEVGHRPRP
jgi:hypothetical protein